MSGSSMNFAKSGYRRVKKTPEELKSVFLDTAKTRKVRENSIVKVPDGIDGSYTEGRVLFIGDEDLKGVWMTGNMRFISLYVLMRILFQHF